MRIKQELLISFALLMTFTVDTWPASLHGCQSNPTFDCVMTIAVAQAKARGEMPQLQSLISLAIATKRTTVADDLIDTAVKRIPENAAPHSSYAIPVALLAEARLRSGDLVQSNRLFREALTHIKSVENDKVQYAKNVLALAHSLERSGRLDDMRELYNTAIQSQLAIAPTLLARVGVMHAKSGNIGHAIAIANELPRISKAMPVTGYSESAIGDALEAMAGGLVANRFLASQTHKDRFLEYFTTLASTATAAMESSFVNEASTLFAEAERGFHAAAFVPHEMETIRVEMTSLKVQRGETALANSLFVEYPTSSQKIWAWSRAASALCLSGQYAPGLAKLEAAARLADKQSPYDLSRLASGYASCKRKELARTTLQAAKAAADATPRYRGDVGGPFKEDAQNHVARQIVNSGEADLLENWPNESSAFFGIQMLAAIQAAKMGQIEIARRRIQSTEAKGVSEMGERESALAQVSAIAGNHERARTEASRAIAFANDNPFKTAHFYTLLANAQIHAQSCSEAVPTLREARRYADKALLSINSSWFSYRQAARLFSDVSASFARCGLFKDARITALSVFTTGGAWHGLDVFAEALENAVLAEIAIARASAGNIAGAIADLSTVGRTPAKFSALKRIANEKTKNSRGESNNLAISTLQSELDYAGAYFGSTRNDGERALLFGEILEVNRLTQSRIAELLEMRSQIRSKNWYSRSSCKLGYTMHSQGHKEADLYFHEGVTAATDLNGRSENIALGACAYWLKESGKIEQARSLVAHILRTDAVSLELHQPTDQSDIASLIRIASSLADFEFGDTLLK